MPRQGSHWEMMFLAQIPSSSEDVMGTEVCCWAFLAMGCGTAASVSGLVDVTSLVVLLETGDPSGPEPHKARPKKHGLNFSSHLPP